MIFALQDAVVKEGIPVSLVSDSNSNSKHDTVTCLEFNEHHMQELTATRQRAGKVGGCSYCTLYTVNIWAYVDIMCIYVYVHVCFDIFSLFNRLISMVYYIWISSILFIPKKREANCGRES